MQEWYNGYQLDSMTSVYSPRSVIASIQSGCYCNYWGQTETYETLNDDIIAKIAGVWTKLNTNSFQINISSIHSKDDVLTLLIHLGYLGYDARNQTVHIPIMKLRKHLSHHSKILTGIGSPKYSKIQVTY